MKSAKAFVIRPMLLSLFFRPLFIVFLILGLLASLLSSAASAETSDWKMPRKNLCVALLLKNEAEEKVIQDFFFRHFFPSDNLNLKFAVGPKGLQDCLSQDSSTEVLMFSHALENHMTYVVDGRFVPIREKVLSNLIAKSKVAKVRFINCNPDVVADAYLSVIADSRLSWVPAISASQNEPAENLFEQNLVQLLRFDWNLLWD